MPESFRVLVGGLCFPEGLRWRDGQLYFSDVFGRRIASATPDGVVTDICPSMTDMPSGLGWRPDGTLLAVGISRRELLAVQADGSVRVVAELAALTTGMCNDMVVDSTGRAYIGHFGYDYVAGDERRPSTLVLVDVDGSSRVVADGLWFPNGMAITPDGTRLLVAETHGQRISSFVIGSDGSLTGRGVFAEFDDVRPDGICLDASGALWMASPATGQVLRVAEGGRVLDRIDLENGPSCCALGGSDSKILYVSSGPYHDEAEARSERRGRIVAIDL